MAAVPPALFSVRRGDAAGEPGPVSLAQLAAEPLALPSHPNNRRAVIDRAFNAAGLTPVVAVECSALSSELSAVRAGVGSTIINTGDLADISVSDLPPPVLVEPPLYLTCSVIASGNAPLTQAGEAVRKMLIDFMSSRYAQTPWPGAEWVG